MAEIFDNLPVVRSEPKFCTDNAAMIAWMGWELINAGQAVDLREFEQRIQPLTSIPLGSYIEDSLNIPSKTLSNMRQQYQKRNKKTNYK